MTTTLRSLLNLLVAASFFHTPFAFSFQTNLDSLYHAAVAQQRAERYTEAKRTARLLLNLRPSHHDARNLYARVLAWEGNFGQAVVQYDSVLIVDKGNRDARYGKGLVLAWMEQYREAQSIFDQLHADDPSNTDYLLQLGNVALWSNQPDHAYAYYLQAYRLDSSSVDIVRGLARSSARVHNSQKAMDWYRKLQMLSPGDSEARREIHKLSYASQHEIQVHWQREIIDQATASHNTTALLEYYYTIRQSWKPYLHFGSVSKFGKRESRFGGGLYSTVRTGTGLFFQMLLSPEASVIPSFDATLEVNQELSRGIEGLVAYRYLGFEDATVHVLSPGLTMYPSDRWWFTPRVYFSRSSLSKSTAGLLTAFYLPSDRVTLRFGVTAGDESFRATTLREILSVRSRGFFLGAKTLLHKNLALEGFYQYTARQLDVHFHQFTTVVSLLF